MKKFQNINQAAVILGAVVASLLLLTQVAQAEKNDYRSAGYLYAQEGENKIVLPLQKTKVHFEITGGVIEAEVRQVFTNTEKQALEAIYVFPLPSESTLTGMELHFKNKIIRSEVKERQEAQAIYEKAKDEGKKTALVEEDRPNIFTTSVANFMPGETVEVVLKYIEPAKFLGGRYEVFFPTVVGPRYIPVYLTQNENGEISIQTPVEDASRITPPLIPEGMDANHKLEITANIAGIPIQKIESLTHAIEVSQSRSTAEASLQGEDVPNRDFVLKIWVNQGKEPQLSLVTTPDKKSDFALVQVFPPQLSEAKKILPREVIFLIDTSGSMMGDSIVQAREGLLACLKILREQDSFNIVRFSDDYSAFATELKPANTQNLQQAQDYVHALAANGGTEMQPALRYVLSLPHDPEKLRMVIFLTDGDVGNEHELMGLINSQLGAARIFPFGIGSAPNEYLLRKMGELGHGLTNFIHNQEEISQVMSQFFNSINSPVLTNVQIEWRNAAGAVISDIPLYPKALPDVFADRPLQFVARLPKNFQGELSLRGQIDGKAAAFRYPVQAGAEEHAAIRTLFGRARVDDLLYQYNFGQYRGSEALQKDILELALEYQLVTPFTSRVAVEQKVSRDPQGKILSTEVPTMLPAGWDRAGLEAGSTQELLSLLVGMMLMLGALFYFALARSKARAK